HEEMDDVYCVEGREPLGAHDEVETVEYDNYGEVVGNPSNEDSGHAIDSVNEEPCDANLPRSTVLKSTGLTPSE
ncbi:hypothetical protein Dimus_019162, partial [Dionaea muscipula]